MPIVAALPLGDNDLLGHVLIVWQIDEILDASVHTFTQTRKADR